MIGVSTRTTTRTGIADSAEGLRLAAYAAAGLSLLAALIHLWVMLEHFLHWWGYGAFFLVSALAQGLLGVLILRWPASRPISLAGIAGNLTIIVLYVVSRTWGIPFGPSIGHTEDPEILGMSATAAELGLVTALITLLDGYYRKAAINALLLLGALLWALRLTGILP